MRFFRPCFIAGWIFPEALFRIRTDDKLIYLTFDDGPDSTSTPLLLDVLRKHNIKAHFFCCGNSAEKFPELVKLIVSEGHIIGNHSYSHPDGWKSSVKRYVRDVDTASQFTSGKYFRPPYGHLRLRQYFILKKRYKIVFWDIMPYDFDDAFPKTDSLKILNRKIREGSVIVMHDRYHSDMPEYLNRFIESATKSGYKFMLLD